MNSKDIYITLSGIIHSIKKESIIWRVDGSVNLLIQGMNINPNDIDIATNIEGLTKFEKCLSRYRLKRKFSERAKCNSLKGKVGNAEVEILAYEKKEIAMLDKIKTVSWSGLSIPCLPLADAIQFYKLIGRKEKAELIQNFLNTQAPSKQKKPLLSTFCVI